MVEVGVLPRAEAFEATRAPGSKRQGPGRSRGMSPARRSKDDNLKDFLGHAMDLLALKAFSVAFMLSLDKLKTFGNLRMSMDEAEAEKEQENNH